MMKISFSLLLLWIVSANATFVIKEGRCPQVNAMAEFDVKNYLGLWYEYMRFPAVFEAGQQCTSALYTEIPDATDTIRVKNQGYRRGTVFGRNYVLDRTIAEGYAVVPDSEKPAELSVSFPPMLNIDRINYKIIDTDYDSFAVAFSCKEVWTVNIQFAWILTRERGVAPDSRRMNLMERRLWQSGVNVGNFAVVNQEDCPEVEE